MLRLPPEIGQGKDALQSARSEVLKAVGSGLDELGQPIEEEPDALSRYQLANKLGCFLDERFCLGVRKSLHPPTVLLLFRAVGDLDDVANFARGRWIVAAGTLIIAHVEAVCGFDGNGTET